MKSRKNKKFYAVAETLGLDKKIIDSILNDTSREQVSFSSGPPVYPGGRYGTVSIKSF